MSLLTSKKSNQRSQFPCIRCGEFLVELVPMKHKMTISGGRSGYWERRCGLCGFKEKDEFREPDYATN